VTTEQSKEVETLLNDLKMRITTNLKIQHSARPQKRGNCTSELEENDEYTNKIHKIHTIKLK
jgi:hypothetical protein